MRFATRDSVDPSLTVAKVIAETARGNAGSSLEEDKGGKVGKIGSGIKKGMDNQEAQGLALTMSGGASGNLGK